MSTTPSFDLMIFDWDGTLMDSVPRIVSSMQAAARDAEWGELAPEAVENIVGLGLPEAVDILCPGIAAAHSARLRERYAHYFVHADTTPMAFFGGVEARLERLHRQGGLGLPWPRGRPAAASTGFSPRPEAPAGFTPAAPPTRPDPSRTR